MVDDLYLNLQICIGPTIRIGRESWCLPYAGFFVQWIDLGSKNSLQWDQFQIWLSEQQNPQNLRT